MKQQVSENREIRPIGPEYVEEYIEIYLNAYPAFKTLDTDCREYYRQKTRRDMTLDKEVDFFGMFQDDHLISIMKLVNFRMNIYGRIRPAIGLMSLAVHPLFKKQGAALAMVRFYEAYAEEKGADITVLLPFNIEFYRKMGYGMGARIDEYHVRTASLPKVKTLDHLRLLVEADLPDILACHEAFAKANHGMLVKFEEEIREMEADDSVVRIGYYDERSLAGYASYRFKEVNESNYTLNRIEIEELICRDGKVLREILGYFRNQADLAQTIVLRSGEEDFYHLLPDASHVSGYYIPYGYLQTSVSAMGNMYKILDPVRFVNNTSYRSFPAIDQMVTFRYSDEMSGETSDMTITFRNGSWSAANAGTPRGTIITCTKGDLSSLLMNCGRLSSFIRLGVMETNQPVEIPALDQLLYYPQKPYSNSDF